MYPKNPVSKRTIKIVTKGLFVAADEKKLVSIFIYFSIIETYK